MKLLIVSMYFPPAGGGGVQRTLKTATHLPGFGIETHVLAPDDPKWIHRDDELLPPTQAWIHRARYIGPRGRLPAQELHGTHGLERVGRQARLFGRRLLVPDENVTWNLTAIPAAIRIVRREGIDVVLTTSPPSSVHFVGAAVKRATGARWVADLRDSLVAHPHRRGDQNRLVRIKEQGEHGVAGLVARYADAIVAAAGAIAEEAHALEPNGPVVTIENGSDFDDFAGMEHRASQRFRITHTGSFFGRRDPRPFVTALADSGLDVVARFVGDFRPADREWAETLGLSDRLELIPYVPRRRSLELQRDSEALLLLIPEAGGRGRGVLSGKVFEYLAAERPILAAVPPDGAAAELLRRTGAGVVVPPDDPVAIRKALEDLHTRWQSGDLAGTPLDAETRTHLAREARVEELAALLRQVAPVDSLTVAAPEKGRRSIGKYELEWGRVREIVERVIASGERDLSRVLRLVEAEWRGMTAEPAEGVAFGLPVVLPDAALFGGRRDLILAVLQDACRPETGIVAELGSGSGINLLDLHLWGGPRVPYHALEPTEQGRACATLLAGLDDDLRLTAQPFDFESPRYDLPRVEHALVFTSHSIEQVTELPREVITGLFGLGESLTGVHFEPIGWQLRDASDDDPARVWGEKKRYNRDLSTLLNTLAAEGELRIDTVVPDIIGDNRRNASTLVVWHR